MTPQEEALAIIAGDLRYGSWATNPSGVISTITSRAADMVGRSTIGPQRPANYESARLARIACLLVAAAANPYIQRGAVLDSLVERFPSAGLP